MSWPTQDTYFDVVDRAIPAEMDYGLAQDLRWYAAGANPVVYGRDFYAGGCCPLAAVGLKRTTMGPWPAKGAWEFERDYDRLMTRLVGLPGPCLIGVSRVPRGVGGGS